MPFKSDNLNQTFWEIVNNQRNKTVNNVIDISHKPEAISEYFINMPQAIE